MTYLINKMKKALIYDAERDFYAKYYPNVLEDKSILNIRELKRLDIDQLIEIEKQVYNFPWNERTFLDCMKIGYSCWVLERLDEILAYGIVSIAAGEAHVMNVCVNPKHQRKGLGTKMMNQLVDVALEERTKMIMLEVRPSNENAIALYHGMGFSEIGRRKDYYPGEDGREDALMLAMDLLIDIPEDE
jgi:ribosomal-protein-alanine N-acetyltransferase